jgi:hypothetical protein
MTHEITQKEWIARFREELILRAGLERGTDATKSILECEIGEWIDDDSWRIGDESSWKYYTPEEAVIENLSYWEE